LNNHLRQLKQVNFNAQEPLLNPVKSLAADALIFLILEFPFVTFALKRKSLLIISGKLLHKTQPGCESIEPSRLFKTAGGHVKTFPSTGVFSCTRYSGIRESLPAFAKVFPRHSACDVSHVRFN
jgi:hypothetical protein